MKAHHALWIVLVLAVLLFGCQLNGAWLGSNADGGSAVPPDLVADVPRSYAGDFQYETLLPVDLNLTVQLYAPAAKAVEPLTAQEHLVIVTLTDSEGNQVYAGRIAPAGTLGATLSLPAAPEDMVLTLQAPGFETRSVTIRDMVELSAVKRTMSLLQSAAQARSLDLSDRDLDGIPDVYDAYPDDPEVAFSVREPADGYLTVAYEDLYPVPGDADYNDFVAKYAMIENYKSTVPIQETASTMLKTLHGEFTAVAKIAGYNHMFGMVIDYPGITPEKLSVTFCDLMGTPRTVEFPPPSDKAVIWLFLNTKYAVGKTASFDITFPDGVDRSRVSRAPYDPVLKVLQLDPRKAYDIHLIGEDPLPFSPDPAGETFMDANGYPWALLVPTDWQHPAETQYIGKAYPLFDAWREAKGTDFAYWYLYPAATNTKPGNLAPYPVTGPTTIPVFTTGAAATFLLDIDAPAGEPDDPDGDRVYFRSSLVPAGLAGHLTLDADTGLVSIDANVAEGTHLMYFWSEDEYGASTIATPYKVSFSFEAGSTAAYPRLVIDTYPYFNGGSVDTYIELFGAGGDPDPADDFWSGADSNKPDAIAWDDNGNPNHSRFARIDYAGGLEAGPYYIRLRGAYRPFADWYVIRVLTPALGAALPDEIYPGEPATDTDADGLPLPDVYENDDDPSNNWVMIKPVPIVPGNDNYLNRSLDYNGADGTDDVDWFKLVLP